MQTFSVQHVTTYRYRVPVGFGEHRMMLRPREDLDVRLIESKLEISPEPASRRIIHDAFGNHVEVARFSGLARELRFESAFRVSHAARAFTGVEIEEHASRYPFAYGDDERPDLASFIEQLDGAPSNDVGLWARRFPPAKKSIETLKLLEAINQAIRHEFEYRRRETKGVQTASETLRLKHGSCRDFAVLMIEACRSLGFAARFASGYLAVPLEHPEVPRAGAARGATHAWAQVYLPGAGWIDFDPTSGKVGKRELITVAVVRDPRHAIPLYGTFIGAASDALGMEVEVNVRHEPTPEAPRSVVAR